MNYINHIKAILAEGGLSQGQLAERLGVTFAALNRWVNGHAKPRPDKVQAILLLHKQIVGFPSITENEVAQAVSRTEKLKRKTIWNQIAQRQDVQDELLLEHTYNSTAIEGTTFTKKETERVIFDKGVIPDKTLIEHLEVTNHAAVLRGIFRRLYAPPITEQLILRLHRDLMQGIREDAGSYSKHQRGIRGVDIALTHPADIPEEMGRLVSDWEKKHKKTVEQICRFHVDFELIHPFGDGNGRVGRLLMVLQCLQQGLPPAVIENVRRAEYYEVLEYAQKSSDKPFTLFVADEMERTNKILKKYL